MKLLDRRCLRILSLGLLAGPLGAAVGVGQDEGELVMPESNSKNVVKSLTSYFEDRAAGKLNDAQKEIEKIQKELDKFTKKADDVDDALTLVGDWREMVRRGLVPKRLTKQFGRFGNKPVEFEFPGFLTDAVPESARKDLAKGKVFDGKLKAWMSAPKDWDKVAYPVILALHPLVAGEGQSTDVKELTPGAEIVKSVETWVQEQYPESILDRVIVVAPIMDLVIPNADGLTGRRPTWDDPEDKGMFWAISALRETVLLNGNFDPSRMYYDGYGTGAYASLLFCSRFPGMMSGAIVRGEPAPRKLVFNNCESANFLFVGAETKDFYDKQAGEERFQISHVDTLDAEAAVEWVQGNRKAFSPDRVHLEFGELSYGSAYWLQTINIDFTREGDAVVTAEIKRDENEIVVTSNRKFKAFRVYLNDSMLDLDKKIRILHRRLPEDDGELEPQVDVAYEGTVARLLQGMLDNAWNQVNGNVGEVYVAHVNVDVGT